MNHDEDIQESVNSKQKNDTDKHDVMHDELEEQAQNEQARVKQSALEKEAQEEQNYLLEVKQGMIDQDLFEPLTHREMHEMLKQEQHRSRQDKTRKTLPKDIRRVGLVLALVVLIQGLAIAIQTFNIPVIDFVKTSMTLSLDEEVQQIKETVAVIDTGSSRGTGFLISEDGLIVTNAHVVDEVSTVTVGLKSFGLLSGEVIKSDPSVDLALVKVSGGDYPYLHLSDTPGVTGEQVTFVGNPLRFNRMANRGVIEGRVKASLDTSVYMIDAPIYKGNSGSPVVNEVGEVIAVIYATRESDTFKKVGLAIPVDHVQDMLADLSDDTHE